MKRLKTKTHPPGTLSSLLTKNKSPKRTSAGIAYKPIVRKTSIKSSSTSTVQPAPQLIPLELKLRPMEAFYSHLDHRKLARSRVDALSLRSPASFVNSACLSLNLSDTLLNVFRDINFDSCTLCVCMHHTIKGVDYPLYICQDIFNVSDESDMNVYNSSAGCLSQAHQQSDPMPSQSGVGGGAGQMGASDANVSLQGYIYI